MEFIVHIVEHALEDTVALIPFLFITYLALEALEHAAGGRANDAVRVPAARGRSWARCWAWSPNADSRPWRPRCTPDAWCARHPRGGVPLNFRRDVLPMLVAERIDAGQLIAILGGKVAIALVTGIVVSCYPHFAA